MAETGQRWREFSGLFSYLNQHNSVDVPVSGKKHTAPIFFIRLAQGAEENEEQRSRKYIVTVSTAAL